LAKKKKKTNFYNFILLLVFVSFIIYLIDNWRISQEVYTVNQGTLEITIESEGTLYRDEKIIYAHGDGVPSFFVEEGSRIKSGTIVAQQFSDFDSKSLSDEINIINEIIDVKRGDRVPNNDVGSAFYNEIKNNIQSSLFSNDYSSMTELINSLDTHDYNYKYSAYENYSIEELTGIRESLRKSLTSDKINYYSPSGGLISYTFDGLENLYTIESLETINLNDIAELNYRNYSTMNQTVNSGEPIYKIIDNFKWYLAFELNKQDILDLLDRTSLRIRLSRINKIVPAEIVRIREYGEKGLLLLEVDRYLHDYLYDRYIRTDIILQSYEGLIIKNESIIELNGSVGVYVSDANKVVRFRPIKIIGQNDTHAVVDEGEKLNVGSRGRIQVGESFYQTIKIYDSIVLRPENVYDGQILR